MVLQSSPVLAHYRAYFGEAYDGLKREITNAVREFHAAQAGDVPAAFERSVRESVERQGFWKAFADVPVVEIDTAAIARTWKSAREQVERLLEAKRAAPLEALSVPDDVERAIAAHNAQCDRINELSEQLTAANPLLDTVKEQAREASIATLESDLANLRAVEARHDPAIASLCDAYLTEKAAKSATEQRRNAARTALDQHRQAAFHQRPGQRHGIGHPFDREDGDDRRQGDDGRDIHSQTLQPPSMTFTVPVVKAASSLAR